MSIPLDEVCHFDVITNDPTSREPTDADSGVTYSVFEEATDTPILSAIAMTKRTDLTGHYRGAFTASAANGFEVGKWYNVVVSATVSGTAGKAIAKTFRVTLPEEEVGAVPASLSTAGMQNAYDAVFAALGDWVVPSVEELDTPRSTTPMITGVVVDHASNSNTTWKTNLTQTEDNHFKYPMLVLMKSGALQGQLGRLTQTGYDGTSKFFTFLSTQAFTDEPAAGDEFEVIHK